VNNVTAPEDNSNKKNSDSISAARDQKKVLEKKQRQNQLDVILF